MQKLLLLLTLLRGLTTLLCWVAENGRGFYGGKLRVYVARWGRGNNNSAMNSRPCNQCIDIMRRIGIDEVIYTTGENSHDNYYKVEKISTIEYQHISAGNRHWEWTGYTYKKYNQSNNTSIKE